MQEKLRLIQYFISLSLNFSIIYDHFLLMRCILLCFIKNYKDN